MRKKKHKKNSGSPSQKSSSPSQSSGSSEPTSSSEPPVVDSPKSDMEAASAASPEPVSPPATIAAQDPTPLAKDKISDLVETSVSQIQFGTNTSRLVEESTDPGLSENSTSKVASPQVQANAQVSAKSTSVADPDPKPQPSSANSWSDLFKGPGKKLSKKGKPFNLSSGEACVKISDTLIEKNKKSWDLFILGQFYSDPPSQGTIHNIVNGIWSKYYRDITVSKMEGFAFLFRIPSAATQSRVLEQRLWQIEGQTMFVGKWEPGIVPVKPELTSAPIWLELRNVPYRCFNNEALERIATAVGEPKCLHPSTANKTNLEVAKVFTLIDPRKPLPEAVNVKFDSGEICRVLVSSPWMPPICGHCKGIGHTIKRCKSAPITCQECKSSAHSSENCPRAQAKEPKKKKRGRSRSKSKGASTAKDIDQLKRTPATGLSGIISKGESSNTFKWIPKEKNKVPSVKSSETEAEADSSDVLSSDSEGYVSPEEEYDNLEDQYEGFTEVPKHQKFVDKLLPGWSLEDNYAFSTLGKIWIVWHPSVRVVTIAKSLQMITSEVLLPDSSAWIVISVVYASNDETERKALWAELKDLALDRRVASRAWLVLGDFNQTLNPHEHSIPAAQNINRRMVEFRNTLQDAELSDLTFKGETFTWWNKSVSRPVAKKLDRALINEHWMNQFPASYAKFGEPDFSDHTSYGVILDHGSLSKKRPFRFFNYLLQNEELLPLIADHWFSCSVFGSAMFRVSRKLKLLKNILRKFSKQNYSGIEKRTAEAHAIMLGSQQQVLADPSPSNAVLELEAQKRWRILATAEEAFHRQKSRVTWLK
ncbi:unnamed protein product [Microthlaspi erraticum]|uniref:Uncharacterized protein n=1 Tax=Microthlaspi erraticum TaxID=1685480 RepID=A0A6D2I0D4_9BRAS|nr:unnamed protein product [Microthlaspi erraticum]